MWRFVFLILVVLGAFAALLAIILGAGVAKVAMIQNEGEKPVVEPATKPAASPPSATRPAAISPPVSTDPAPRELHQPVVPPNRPIVVVDPPPRPGPIEGAAVKPAADFVPGTIVLRASDAKLHGKTLRKTPPEGDLTSWTRPDDYASWKFNPAHGKYRVVVTRANGANSGGDFAVAMSDSKKADPLFIAKAGPTGGWDVFRSEFIGILDLDDKKVTIAMRPVGDITSALMRLRKIELIPVDPAVALKPGNPNDDGPPEITGLTIMEAATGKPLGMLTSSMVLDVSALPPISLRAETAGRVGSVKFSVNKVDRPVESERPFSIAGERGAGYIPWNPEPGKLSLVVAPFSEPRAGGQPGKRQAFYFTIAASKPIVLSAKDAILRGALRLQGGDEPTITSWTGDQDWVEWTANIPNDGNYDVEFHYSVAKGHGGDFVLRVGDAKVSDDVVSTGGWEIYDRTRVGVAKLSRGMKRISLKPNDLDEGKMLMNLREIRLIPVVDDDE